ncbi:cell envelope integrity protein TolA [Rhodoferax sp. 4810]|uniref:Cell envelope integrity protein TolA n=1 Tax=Thiospirillum jenense TaxID=1653858 RepID=A0A839HES9_9GAMM|nr:cell envelope integrity protein TolA [Thiospirillum jenense]MBB1074782.1 cell envelope integrity protein TolA [Rhodoferax jenense]MBB1126620.1 cell envelope integrity protein TolA [Thiospirillum jenense]
MSAETSFFRSVWFIVLTTITTSVGLVGGALEALVWYSRYQDESNTHSQEVSENVKTQTLEEQKQTEAERNAEAQRLIEYGAQQALAKMQAQQEEALAKLQAQIEAERNAEAQRLIEYGEQQALAKMQTQQQELAKLQAQIEAERNAEARRLIEYGEQQALAKMQAQSEVKTQPIEQHPLPSSTIAQSLECFDAKQCLTLNLNAAANENFENVRDIAIQFDSLKKPKPGNRVAARKLNDEGLAAMKNGDFGVAVSFFREGLAHNLLDVEIAANMGYAFVRNEQPKDAITVLTLTLVINPRRSATWAPLAEAFALNGQLEEAVAALWIEYQWSPNQEKLVAIYQKRIEKEQDVHPEVADMYRAINDWIISGQRPNFHNLIASSPRN